MKNKVTYLFLSIILLLTGCVSNKVSIDYDNSNPIKIEESAEKLEISDFFPPLIEKKINNGTIAIRSIESDLDDGLDASLRYLIEDNLIVNLIDNGYKVLERDPEILHNLYRESSDKFRLPKEVVKLPVGVDNSNLNSVNYIGTNLNSADYILSYRVLECGISYRQPSQDLSAFKVSGALTQQVERIAITRLHLRLTDSKTSEIITAGLLGGETKDLINEGDIKDLKKINYNFYSHSLPLSFIDDSNVEPDDIRNKEKFKYGKNAIKWGAAVGGTCLLMMVMLD